MGEEHIKESFVARIWVERGSNGEPRWRGHIRHVQGQEEIYFQDFMEVSRFLERVSGVSGPGLTSKPNEDTAIPKLRTVTNKERDSK